jgi:Bacterial Ig-like domain
MQRSGVSSGGSPVTATDGPDGVVGAAHPGAAPRAICSYTWKMLRRLALLLAAQAVAVPVLAQGYGDRYGDPRDVTLDSLSFSPESYDNKPIRISGRLEMLTLNVYVLSEGMSLRLLVQPVPEIQSAFLIDANRYLGRRVELVGLFEQARGYQTSGSSGVIGRLLFWDFTGPPEKLDGKVKALDIGLESLVTSPGQRDGQMVRVVGQFRGRNLYRDLPSSSQRRSDDWVIKDDAFAIWVTGLRPRGDGFRLDPGLKRDTGKWLEVTGSLETRRGVTYVKAVDVRLASAPLRADAGAEPAPAPPEPPKRPPVVVFSLPLDGEEIPTSTLFRVQFSKDMDEESFRGRIALRYAGPRRAGDRAFDGVRLEYDGGLRALTVDPGDVLRPGREVQLLLLEGIRDVQGLPLEGRPGVAIGDEEIVDVLRFTVSRELASN